MFVKREVAKLEHKFENLYNCRSIGEGIQQKRKEYLGSDLGLTMFVHKNGMPDEKAVQNLSVYLGKLTSYFLDKEYNAPCMEELCIGFFYYSLQIYAHNKVGNDSFDDLIQLAELFENDIVVLTIVFEQDLDQDIIDDWSEFLLDNEYVPRHFTDAVIGALAVLLGVITK